MSNQSFETEPHGFCIGRCATGFLRVAVGDLINVERLLHTFNATIQIRHNLPYRIGRDLPVDEERGSVPLTIVEIALTATRREPGSALLR
jgi:hypothetical protein